MAACLAHFGDCAGIARTFPNPCCDGLPISLHCLLEVRMLNVLVLGVLCRYQFAPELCLRT